jgi:hypothetical protein
MIYEGIRQYIRYVSKYKLQTAPFKQSVLRPNTQSIEIPVKRFTTGLISIKFKSFQSLKLCNY